MKKMSKKMMSMIIGLPAVCMLSGYLLIVMTYLFPNEKISANVQASSEILIGEGTYAGGFVSGWFLDNWTDADCISIVYNEIGTNPFYNALNGFQMAGKDDPYTGSIEALYSTAHGLASYDRIGDHSRLWHGYRIWLRPLLLRYNIKEIRDLLFISMNILIVLTCIYLAKARKNMWAAFPFMVAVTFFNFQMESLSLLFFTDIFIMLLGSMAVIYISDKKLGERWTWLAFEFTGFLVAFSSMLIMPILTLCFPLIIWNSLNAKKRMKDNFVCTVKYSMAWCWGYGITMVFKILISCLIFPLGERGKVAYYMGRGVSTIYDRLYRMYSVFSLCVGRSKMERDLLFVAILILTVYIVFKCRNKIKNAAHMMPVLLVAMYPFAWCFICVIHAGHGWTNWIFSSSLLAILQFLYEIINTEEERAGNL